MNLTQKYTIDKDKATYRVIDDAQSFSEFDLKQAA